MKIGVSHNAVGGGEIEPTSGHLGSSNAGMHRLKFAIRRATCVAWPIGWSSARSRKPSWSRRRSTGGRCGKPWTAGAPPPGARRCAAARGHAASRPSAIESRARGPQEGLPGCGAIAKTPDRPGADPELRARHGATALAHRDATEDQITRNRVQLHNRLEAQRARKHQVRHIRARDHETTGRPALALAVPGAALGILVARWSLQALMAMVQNGSAVVVRHSHRSVRPDVHTGGGRGHGAGRWSNAGAACAAGVAGADLRQESGRNIGPKGRRRSGERRWLARKRPSRRLCGFGHGLRARPAQSAGWDTDVGFDPAGLSTFRTDPPYSRLGAITQTSTFYRQAIERLKERPGVLDAASNQRIPFASVDAASPRVSLEGQLVLMRPRNPSSISRSSAPVTSMSCAFRYALDARSRNSTPVRRRW